MHCDLCHYYGAACRKFVIVIQLEMCPAREMVLIKYWFIELLELPLFFTINSWDVNKKHGWQLLTAIIWSDTLLSSISSGLSSRMKTKSKRERSAALIFRFSFTVFARLHQMVRQQKSQIVATQIYGSIPKKNKWILEGTGTEHQYKSFKMPTQEKMKSRN